MVLLLAPDAALNSDGFQLPDEAEDALTQHPMKLEAEGRRTVSDRPRGPSSEPFDVCADQVLPAAPGSHTRERSSHKPQPGGRHALGSMFRSEAWRNRRRDIWLRYKGMIMVLLAQLFGVLMNVLTRLLEANGQGMHPFQILFARQSITAILCCIYMYRNHIPDFPLGKPDVRSLLVVRGVGGFFGVFGMYFSLQYLPIAEATVLTFLSPSLASWACSIFIDEPFTRMEQIAGLIALSGVILIARPSALFSSSSPVPIGTGLSDGLPSTGGSAMNSGQAHISSTKRLTAVGVAMLGVCGTACAITTIRWIGKRAHPLISVNYFATWGTFVSMMALLALPGIGFQLPANATEWAYLLASGIFGFIFQFLLTAGLQHEKSSRATNMIYTQMLFALVLDKLVWGTTPGMLSIVGSSLILGSAVCVAIRKESQKVPKRGGEEGRGVAGDEEIGLVEDFGSDDDEEEEEGGRTLEQSGRWATG